MTMNENADENERFHEYVQAGVPAEKAREYARQEAQQAAYFALKSPLSRLGSQVMGAPFTGYEDAVAKLGGQMIPLGSKPGEIEPRAAAPNLPDVFDADARLREALAADDRLNDPRNN